MLDHGNSNDDEIKVYRVSKKTETCFKFLLVRNTQGM